MQGVVQAAYSLAGLNDDVGEADNVSFLLLKNNLKIYKNLQVTNFILRIIEEHIILQFVSS